MQPALLLIFDANAIQDLMSYAPDKIVAAAHIEAAELPDGSKVGVVKVKAHAMRLGQEEPLATVNGCPDPPCQPN